RLLRRHRVRVPALSLPDRDGAARGNVRDSGHATLARADRGPRTGATTRGRPPRRVHHPQVGRRLAQRGRTMNVYGGIETGGSKWECAVGTEPEDIRAAETIQTTTPHETIDRTIAFFEREGPIYAVGIGSFGPID